MEINWKSFIAMETNEIIKIIELNERKAKLRAIIITFIPLISAIVLIAYTSNEVYQTTKKLKEANLELKTTKELNEELKVQNDSLVNILQEATIGLGKAVSVLAQTKNFIDRMKPPDRTAEEASYYIEFKMLEEKIRGDYIYLSDKITQLPNIKDDKVWVVIVASSVSLFDLKMEAEQIIKIFGKEQIAIYKTNVYYALVILGNGTFTRAYRLNVDLINKYGYKGAYYSGSKNWGKDYLYWRVDEAVLLADPGNCSFHGM